MAAFLYVLLNLFYRKMHKFVSFNQQLISADNANISAISSAAFYGKGIFTTILIHNGKPFLWKNHWQRLSDNAKTIGIALPDKALLEAEIFRIIVANKILKGRLRISVFDESSSKIWTELSATKTSVLITTADLRSVTETQLTISPYRTNSTSPLANIKSCNYLENLLALEEANKRGFNEAIRLNERNEITSVCMANIFWLKDSNLYTPSLKTGCLAGTIRGLIIENFKVFEVEQNYFDFKADEIFITSSGIGIIPAFFGENINHKEVSKTLNDLQTMMNYNINLLT